MMISPALTCWPPNRFTPSRWALESRPFRLEDAPFLCAIAGLLPSLDAGDAQRRELRAEALTPVVAGLVLEQVDVDLLALDLLDHLSGDRGRRQRLGVRRDLPGVVDEQDGGQRDGLTRSRVEPVDRQGVADGDLVLVAATAHDRVHGRTPCSAAHLVAS